MLSLFMDSVSQEFRKGTVQMACLYLSVCKARDGNALESPSLAYLPPGLVRLKIGAQLGLLTGTLAHGLSWFRHLR